jgi:hypothetical protein
MARPLVEPAMVGVRRGHLAPARASDFLCRGRASERQILVTMSLTVLVCLAYGWYSHDSVESREWRVERANIAGCWDARKQMLNPSAEAARKADAACHELQADFNRKWDTAGP